MPFPERVVNAQAHRTTVETVRQVALADGRAVVETSRHVEQGTGLKRVVSSGFAVPSKNET